MENPVDRGAWPATVHRVAKSQTCLKELCTVSFPRRLSLKDKGPCLTPSFSEKQFRVVGGNLGSGIRLVSFRANTVLTYLDTMSKSSELSDLSCKMRP